MSLVVVSPDGKRELRTTQDQLNCTLHQIKQWAISSLGLPADHYILRYQRKLLDPSLPCRLAGIPNGARVELLSIQMLGPKEILELKAARERLIAVTLVLLGGEQITGKFKGDTSLLAMLHHFEYANPDAFKVLLTAEEGSNLAPVLQIGNETVFGSMTCLYDCGLGGNARIKVVDYQSCTPEDASIHAVSPKIAEAKPTSRPQANPATHINSVVPVSPMRELDYDIDMVVFEAPRNPTSPIPDFPDEFYNLTPAEYKYFQSSACHAVNQLRDRPLLSKSALDKENERKVLETHPFTRIRFRFPDHTCIERNFRTTDSAADLMNWIRMGLSRHAVPEFSLSIGPPPRTLKPHDTLMGLHLYPAAIVNVIWIDQSGVKTTALLGDTRDVGHPAAKRVSSPPVSHAHDHDMDHHQPAGQSEIETKAPKWLKLHK